MGYLDDLSGGGSCTIFLWQSLITHYIETRSWIVSMTVYPEGCQLQAAGLHYVCKTMYYVVYFG